MTDHNVITVRQVWQAIDQLAPPALAAEWDSAIGLEIGNPDQAISHVLITLDVSESVITRAAATGCQLIITHHPLIFTPITTIRHDIPEQRLIAGLLHNKISLIAAHTNLDAAPGGVADCLADVFGLSTEKCQPAGPFGRIGYLPEPMQLSRLAGLARQKLGSSGCRINTDRDRIIKCLAVFPGSFSEEEITLLTESGAEAIVCGEIKHHVGLMLSARGIASIDAGHDVTERVALKSLAKRLGEMLPEISFAVDGGLDYNKMAF